MIMMMIWWWWGGGRGGGGGGEGGGGMCNVCLPSQFGNYMNSFVLVTYLSYCLLCGFSGIMVNAAFLLCRHKQTLSYDYDFCRNTSG